MNKLIISLVTCSGSVAAVLATSTIVNTDSAKTVPYPEVMNLARVPIFNAQGMVSQPNIAGNNLPKRSPQPQSVASGLLAPITRFPAHPAPITVDLVSTTVREAAIGKYGSDCPGCRNLSPSMMVLGYSFDRVSGGSHGTMY
jgi:hypothetical protein